MGEVQEKFEKTHQKLRDPDSLSPRIRAMKESMDLFKTMDPKLNLLLERFRKTGAGQKINGVFQSGGVKKLGENLTSVKSSGLWGKLNGVKNSSLGSAVLNIAENGFNLQTFESMAAGYLWKKGVSGAFEMLAKGATFKTVAIKVGTKAITSIGLKIGGKLGAALVLQAAPIAGQIVSVLMFIPEIVSLVKLPFKMASNFLSKLNINFIKDFADSTGIRGLPDMLLLGGLGVAASIVAIPTLMGGLSLYFIGPVLGGTIGGISLFSVAQLPALSSFVPPREIEPGAHGTATGMIDLQPEPTTDLSNIHITPGCPSKDFWPVNGPVTQGPCGSYSHNYPGHTQAIDFGTALFTPIKATHNGVAELGGNMSSPWGCYIDVIGNCDGMIYRTRYGHMPCGTTNPNLVAINSSGGTSIVSGKGRVVATNDQITQGQIIGYVDSTGNSTGNHLHYELIGTSKMFRINDWVPSPGVYDVCNY